MPVNWEKWHQKAVVKQNRSLLVALRCASVIYGALVRRRLVSCYKRRNYRKKVPALVISVGNIVAGGSGKTPVVRWLAEVYRGFGKRVAIITRGYGRKTRSKEYRLLIEKKKVVEWQEVGDEPMMLRKQLEDVPILVGADRYTLAFRACRELGIEVIILDDGFQHLKLDRDIDLVLLDTSRPFDNGDLIPLGKLREPVSHLIRGDAFILTRATTEKQLKRTKSLLENIFPDKPIFSCKHIPLDVFVPAEENVKHVSFLEGKKVVAFAGIAKPESFFQMLRSCGALLRGTVSYPDHYPYSPENVEKLLCIARETAAEALVTTEKDMVRIPPGIKSKIPILVLRMKIDFADEGAILEWLKSRRFGE